VDFGHWEGLTFDEIAARDPGGVRRWAEDALAFVFPGGEANRAFWDRVAGVYREICGRTEGPLVVVCHGGVIRLMICMALGLDFHYYLSFAVDPGRVALLDVDGTGRGVLRGLNL